jgi:hypothetical protein
MLDALFRPWQMEPPVGGQPRAAKGRTSQARLPEIFMGVPSGSSGLNGRGEKRIARR